MGLANGHGHGNALYKNAVQALSAQSSRCNIQICPPLNLCILATLFQQIHLKSEGLSTLFWIKRVEHANFEKLLQDCQNNAKNVQSLLAVKASTNIFPQNLFSTKTGVNTVRGPALRGPETFEGAVDKKYGTTVACTENMLLQTTTTNHTPKENRVIHFVPTSVLWKYHYPLLCDFLFWV